MLSKALAISNETIDDSPYYCILLFQICLTYDSKSALIAACEIPITYRVLDYVVLDIWESQG